ncbi:MULTISPECIES: sugar phosphate isomerase/epimerase family protein [Paenibacillus]|uniref:Sugar phosphate isomerase n=1 Tax=Paenibacillus campinasensis TaxID=66347 RepID=A0A268F3V8_9BACL|nr:MULTISPECIES: sugar phosphate isomerase/epimerase [Paenibacillus]MUG64768.1 TIM barrel protein [Paenibacillus campinasensis]PAD80051.1 sugar phosphate isomerase [Paenibacillus campinasensis]PAK55478.1 sugar phosphate isomerase [Paenibacillus sp. 7541]
MRHLKIGALIKGVYAEEVIPYYLDHGFESFGITYWQTTGDIDLKEQAKRVRELLGGSGAVVSSLTVFGNPLTGTGDNADTLASWERAIDHAAAFGCDVVSGFTGRIPDEPIPASLPKFKQVFGELARRAEDRGVRLAFENCDMHGTWDKGDWNIAHNPTAWELMFDALPNDNLGLQWEPCHQMVSLIDPIAQLRRWASKIFHVHGKDATIAWDVIREHGIHGPHPFVWHRTPGFGDTNWTDVVTILMQQGYEGSIDIEGRHDPVFKDELEMSAQVSSLQYLKRCRGGEYVTNPRISYGSGKL